MTIDSPSAPQKDPNINQQAIRSIKWSALSQLLPRLVTPVTTMLLAAMLTPDDFGIVAAAALIISMAQILVGMGFGATVVQRKSMVAETASMAFWMNLGLAGAFYGLLWFSAPFVAVFYKMAPLNSVLRVTGLALIISAFTTIPSALLQKELKFKNLFFITAVPQIVNGLVAILLAYFKFGYWALIMGNLAALFCSAILAWLFCQWKPAFLWRPEIAKSIFTFSFWILLANVQSWFFLSADNALAGYFFGAKGLGQYALGFNIATLLAGMIVSPIAAIAYPTFCKLNTRAEIGTELVKVQSLAASLLFPVCVCLAALSSPVVAILYGSKWPELGMIIRILVILPGMSYIWSLNADALRAAGLPAAWTKIGIVGLLFLLPMLFVSGPFGLRAFVFARFLGALIIPLLCSFASIKLLSVSLAKQFQGLKIPLFGSMVLFMLLLVFIPLLAPYQGLFGLIKLGACSLLGVIFYFIVLRIFDKQLYLQLFKITGLAFFSRLNLITGISKDK